MMNPLVRAGVVLGLGIGGFFDGIVLHQILQWHHLVCVTRFCQPTSVAMLKRQNTQDGFFHLGVLALTLCGVALLFRAGGRADAARFWSGRGFLGSLMAGWGVFNFVEGMIDHQILGIHHVLPGPHQFAADMAFLAWGVAFALAGRSLIRADGPGPSAPQAATQA